jgi:hypothetical protein
MSKRELKIKYKPIFMGKFLQYYKDMVKINIKLRLINANSVTQKLKGKPEIKSKNNLFEYLLSLHTILFCTSLPGIKLRKKPTFLSKPGKN